MVEVTDALRRRFAYAALALEVLFLILFATTTEYSENSQPGAVSDVRKSATTEVDHFYPMFQDVHVMMYVSAVICWRTRLASNLHVLMWPS